MTLLLPDELRQAMARQLESAYPGEGCGLMLGHFQPEVARVTELVPAANLAPDPATWYTIDPYAHLQAERRARQAQLDVVGFYHSHPDAPAKPSKHDLAHAWDTYIYLIVPVIRGEAGAARAWRLAGAEFAELAVRVNA